MIAKIHIQPCIFKIRQTVKCNNTCSLKQIIHFHAHYADNKSESSYSKAASKY